MEAFLSPEFNSVICNNKYCLLARPQQYNNYVFNNKSSIYMQQKKLKDAHQKMWHIESS